MYMPYVAHTLCKVKFNYTDFQGDLIFYMYYIYIYIEPILSLHHKIKPYVI